MRAAGAAHLQAEPEVLPSTFQLNIPTLICTINPQFSGISDLSCVIPEQTSTFQLHQSPATTQAGVGCSPLPSPPHRGHCGEVSLRRVQ